MFRKSILSILLTLILSLIFVNQSRAAYIDPNTGGMLFQLLAVLFGLFSGLILLFSSQVKKAFYRVARFFRGSKQESQIEEHSDN
jgi:hypothetical protein